MPSNAKMLVGARVRVLAGLLLLLVPSFAHAQLSDGDPLHIARIHSKIVIDGDLSDEAWQKATKVTTWYETSPGDNTPPTVKNVGYLAYDDKFFYAAFEFDDPNPGAIRAPFGDRDNVPSTTDYGGVILDTQA